jgi:glycosyltransferase involved in cell wall biosynthesis
MNRYVARKCQEIGIDLMVSNSYTTDLLTAQIHDKTGLPYIIVEHGAYSFFLITNEAFDETPITKSLGVVAVSRWTERLLRSRFPQKQTTTILNALVPDAVADNQTFRLSPGPFTFCMHGRDTEQKGWELAIRSFLKFRDAGFNARLVLLCAGPYIDSLKSRYHDREDIIFGGFVYNIGEAIAQVDAGLMLSKHSEAFGLSILDYFSKGKPVIAGKVGGIEEVMIADDLSGGILVNADNGIPRENEVVEAMKRLTMEKETYSAMSRDAKQIVKKFDLKSCADAYDRLFKSAVGK